MEDSWARHYREYDEIPLAIISCRGGGAVVKNCTVNLTVNVIAVGSIEEAQAMAAQLQSKPGFIGRLLGRKPKEITG